MSRKGPKVKLELYCEGCEFLTSKTESGCGCGARKGCTKLNKWLEKFHIRGEYVTIAHSECPYKEKEVMAFHTSIYTGITKAIIGNTYQHKKGGYYKVIEIGNDSENEEAKVIYKSLEDDKVWIRSKSEFEDGRFKQIKVRV